ncbi:acyltransferase family protein [Mesorhizobium koreense]|uniref:acyltransferase family protein n=1 Tax=Mesorhizobium koreense TaxID=3074855 RepID=UPI00287BC6E9|nr:acyltransferase [Mesorhizobium sp. WR6]
MRRVECLDGLRGIAALWVLFGHAMILTGFSLPIVGHPDLGVDLFILLSGFLMVFQYQLRRETEDWAAPHTWVAFWTRRFFRIAPLFYLMLAAALILGPFIYENRVFIDTFLGRTPQNPARYLDSGLKNVVMHLSFAFGLFPHYAYRTPLPDWSLGLEMQFYAVFPFLILLARKAGWYSMVLLVAAAGIMVAGVMRWSGIGFPMPSFLPLKIQIFLCGMLIAADHRLGAAWLAARLGLAFLLAAVPIGGHQDFVRLFMRELLVLIFFLLVHGRKLAMVGPVASLLGGKFFHWLGELSFGVYLVHLLIMQPVAGWAIDRFGAGIGDFARFCLVVAIVVPATYLTAFVTYNALELPGQRLGKSVLRYTIGSRTKAKQTRAEEIAAP